MSAFVSSCDEFIVEFLLLIKSFIDKGIFILDEHARAASGANVCVRIKDCDIWFEFLRFNDSMYWFHWWAKDYVSITFMEAFELMSIEIQYLFSFYLNTFIDADNDGLG